MKTSLKSLPVAALIGLAAAAFAPAAPALAGPQTCASAERPLQLAAGPGLGQQVRCYQSKYMSCMAFYRSQAGRNWYRVRHIYRKQCRSLANRSCKPRLQHRG